MTNIDDVFINDVGKRLKELRSKSNLTQKALAEKVNISEATVARCERGETLLDTTSLVYIAEFFNVTTDYILYGKELSDDNSFTWYDTFKRLNRLIYPLAVGFGKSSEDGKIYLELWDDEAKVYYDKLQSYGRSANYMYEHRDSDPNFGVKDMDALFEEFQKFDEQLSPNLDRWCKYAKSQGIDPEKQIQAKVAEIKSKREK